MLRSASDNSCIVLQMYDQRVLNKEETSEALGINFVTGSLTEYWNDELEEYPLNVCSLFFQLHDKQLISKELLTEVILGA